MIDMDYTTMRKIYYTDDASLDDVYRARYTAPFTRHFQFTVRQTGRQSEYPAFLCYTEEIILRIEKAYKDYEKFLLRLHSIPPVVLHQFELFCIIDEVKSTNDIEGVCSTHRELRDVIDGRARDSRFSSIINKYQSLLSDELLSLESPEDVRSFYDAFAHEEVAAENPRNRLDGELFRKEPVDVTTATGRLIHRGIYPESSILRHMSVALDIVHDESIPTLIRMAVFHFLFGYIHPFYDGNGRTGRFIISYFMARHFHYIAALRLSVVIRRRQKKYYDLFSDAEEEINRGDLTPFVYEFISIISDTFEDATDILGRKTAQLNRYREKLLSMIPADELTRDIYFILLQASLFYGQGVSMQDIMRITGKSRNTIQSRIDEIPEERLVIRKMKTFYYKLNMLLFKEVSSV